jgi:hypothetical protein
MQRLVPVELAFAMRHANKFSGPVLVEEVVSQTQQNKYRLHVVLKVYVNPRSSRS